MANLAQRSFASGEIAPALYGRTDVIKYATGLRTCRNFLVQKHSGVVNRPGTDYTTEVKDSSAVTRLLKFVFNADQTYVLEFGNLYMRVIRDGAPIVLGSEPTWADATDYVVGDLVIDATVYYYCTAAHTSSAATDEPGAGSDWENVWYALPNNVYEIPTPYLTADLRAIQYVQSADIITLTHSGYPVADLRRTDHTHWTLTPTSFTPSIAAPTHVLVSGGSVGGPLYWAVTAIASETFEESLYGFVNLSGHIPSTGTPSTVTWDAVTGAQLYNIYRSTDGVQWGYIGSAASTTFSDVGATADTTIGPPLPRNPFDVTGNYPSAVGYYQQRKIFANTENAPEKVWASRSANFNNFTNSYPIQDDDAVTFTLAGRQVNAVRHLIDLDKLIILTSGSAWSVEGNADGVLLPTAVNLRQRSYHGASTLFPLVVGSSLLYVQARGSIVRDLTNDAIVGYKDNDVTIFSSHLFEGYTILAWDYQEIPHSIAWMVRSDGVLLGLTYIPEQQLWGWHRHDTDGVIEDVCTIPEGEEDRVYLIVRRTINGATKRYIERMASRSITPLTDRMAWNFVDCSLVYDGRVTSDATVTLSGGTEWSYDESLTLTKSAANPYPFTDDEIGNQIVLTDATGRPLRCTITAVADNVTATVQANRTVPDELRAVAQANWTRAVNQVAGLEHLEGKAVSVFADGLVAANPNNPSYDPVVVTDGIATLDRPYGVIRVGLPYLADVETLDIDTAQGPSLKDKKISINKVGMLVDTTAGLFAGATPPVGNDPTADLFEVKARSTEAYDEPIALTTDLMEATVTDTWRNSGRIFVRQIDPLPASILALIPQGYLAGAA